MQTVVESILDVVWNAAGMAWKIAWGLALGFAVSAAIQAFVSRQRIAEHLGKLNPRSLLLATGFGCASSSCSYAAAAMSKTLFQKGAHIGNATAFLFASTNLVIEIGLVIWVLLGWHFVLAEFVGGILLIAIAAVALRCLLPQSLVASAADHLAAVSRGASAGGHEHDHHGHHGADSTLPLRDLWTLRGARAVGRYFSQDLRMVSKDIAIGVAIAGALAALVPREWWQAVFLSGGEVGGFWVRVENAVLGPVIAVLSFVCSVGNIPLAAVLWKGGSSFGGVIAFIFADLVTIPMVLVYRRYYGWRPALIYAAFLFAVMVATALATDGIFVGLGLVPQAPTGSAAESVRYFAWDYTTWLNLVLLPLAVWLFWIGRRDGVSHDAQHDHQHDERHRERERTGGREHGPR